MPLGLPFAALGRLGSRDDSRRLILYPGRYSAPNTDNCQVRNLRESPRISRLNNPEPREGHRKSPVPLAWHGLFPDGCMEFLLA